MLDELVFVGLKKVATRLRSEANRLILTFELGKGEVAVGSADCGCRAEVHAVEPRLVARRRASPTELHHRGADPIRLDTLAPARLAGSLEEHRGRGGPRWSASCRVRSPPSSPICLDFGVERDGQSMRRARPRPRHAGRRRPRSRERRQQPEAQRPPHGGSGRRPRLRLDRMPHRVAEIEHCPAPGVALIGCDHRSSCGRSRRSHRAGNPGPAPRARGPGPTAILHQRGLHHLHEARREPVPRQGLEGGRICGTVVGRW